LDIHYTGETHGDAILNQIIVFDPALKVVSSAEDVTSAYFLARSNLLAGSDSLFAEDLRGEQLVSYRNHTASTIYKANENEAIFWDREKNRFYSAVANKDTLSVYDLFNQHKPIIKISGLDKLSGSLFINNNLLFLFNKDNIYHINIETTAGTGYKTMSMAYSIYPNKNGFFCHYNSISDGAGDMQAYSFIPIPPYQ
jgi:hypothetical protein